MVKLMQPSVYEILFEFLTFVRNWATQTFSVNYLLINYLSRTVSGKFSNTFEKKTQDFEQ